MLTLLFSTLPDYDETTENYVNKHKTRFILMLKVILCDNKTRKQQQQLYEIHSRCSKCLPLASTFSRYSLI